ncbi:MAG: RidA family protein [Bacillota bacterium]|nr:RidA family protein [Bacillota bacterium]HRV32821.1 RidA family protein [Anaerovoracaceae bacterium]
MKTIATQNAPGAIGPYSQAQIVGNMVFTSGQLGLDPATGDFVGADVQAQAKKSLENLKAILEAAGTGMDKVCKTTVFLSDMANFGAVNEIYGTFFKEGAFPARSCVEVAALPKGGLVEIEAVAEL